MSKCQFDCAITNNAGNSDIHTNECGDLRCTIPLRIEVPEIIADRARSIAADNPEAAADYLDEACLFDVTYTDDGQPIDMD